MTLDCEHIRDCDMSLSMPVTKNHYNRCNGIIFGPYWMQSHTYSVYYTMTPQEYLRRIITDQHAYNYNEHVFVGTVNISVSELYFQYTQM